MAITGKDLLANYKASKKKNVNGEWTVTDEVELVLTDYEVIK